jgi:hypothetical protein
MKNLDDIINSKEFDDLLSMTDDEKKIHNALFNSDKEHMKIKLTLQESMEILQSGEREIK